MGPKKQKQKVNIPVAAAENMDTDDETTPPNSLTPEKTTPPSLPGFNFWQKSPTDAAREKTCFSCLAELSPGEKYKNSCNVLFVLTKFFLRLMDIDATVVRAGPLSTSASGCKYFQFSLMDASMTMNATCFGGVAENLFSWLKVILL